MIEKSKERIDFERHYEVEIRNAIRNPGKPVICHQRYTFREWLKKLFGKQFTPTHERLAVTFYQGMGFLTTSASVHRQ
jgi:hypothetical protein